MFLTVISWVLSPIGKYVSVAMVVLAVVGGIYAKARIDQYHADQARIERQAVDAVQKANAARAAAQKKFDSGSDSNRPGIIPGRVRHGSDGFARD